MKIMEKYQPSKDELKSSKDFGKIPEAEFRGPHTRSGIDFWGPRWGGTVERAGPTKSEASKRWRTETETLS